ncbi:pilus assembly protein TadG-related protein [Paraburkholderia sp. A1BS-2L]|uniref:pilus assembly protein TadG-related protein n=1 Tax=Paraburkholderia sp. A1BS-2L TaxID=3028373 RepID=UPI003DA7A891
MRRGNKGKQEGAVAVTVALFMVFLLGIAALTIDIGNLLVARNELQNSADAAALAGAACLYQRTECNNTTVPEPDWSDAQASAVSFATDTFPGCFQPQPPNAPPNKNLVQGCFVKTVSTASGYWNVTGTPAGLQMPGALAPGNNDMPAIQVTVAKDPSNANGGIPTYLAAVLGVNILKASATATAVISRPGYVGSHGLFPLAMPKCMYDEFWSTANNAPVLYPNGPTLDSSQPQSQTNGDPYLFNIGSPYHVTADCLAGQWTTFNPSANGGCSSAQSDQCIDNMITGGGNTGALGIGDSIFVKSGTANNLFKDTNACSAAAPNPVNRTCEWVSVPVVNSVTSSTTGSSQAVVAFACLHVLGAKNGSNPSVTVQMSADQSKCTVANSGGVGPNYGAITPPRLVQ